MKFYGTIGLTDTELVSVSIDKKYFFDTLHVLYGK